eukprot:2157856-Prymnesium_polylepis.1
MEIQAALKLLVQVDRERDELHQKWFGGGAHAVQAEMLADGVAGGSMAGGGTGGVAAGGGAAGGGACSACGGGIHSAGTPQDFGLPLGGAGYGSLAGGAVL